MVPVIASGGASFKGAFAYYMHDKNAQTSTRVAWTHTMNMMTDCVEKAWKVMAYTAKAQQRLKKITGQKLTGRKLAKPVFAYSLSWHPEQKPDKAEMLETAKTSLAKLGLTEYEVAIAAHKDEPQPHVHIIVNRVHPVTGIAANMRHSKRKLSDFAREYERQHGKVYCKQREENHRKRQQGKNTRHNDPVIAGAWKRSDNAQEFKTLLKGKGYQLAQGRKRLVVVDPHGKTHNPTRHLKGVAKAGEFNRRMDSLDHDQLPTVEAVAEERKAKAKEHREIVREFEEEAAEAISKTTSKHYEQQSKLLDQHNRDIRRKRVELEEYYKLGEKQEQLDGLQHQLARPSIIQKVGFKLFRTDRKLRDTIGQLEATKANAQGRFDEAITKLEADRDRSLYYLKRRQAEDLEIITNNLEQWRPRERTYTQSWSSIDRERQRSRERDGPSLGR